jgi:hypothetical protein
MTQTEWETVDRAPAVLKRLANPLRLLTALRRGLQSVSALQDKVGATQPAASM